MTGTVVPTGGGSCSWWKIRKTCPDTQLPGCLCFASPCAVSIKDILDCREGRGPSRQYHTAHLGCGRAVYDIRWPWSHLWPHSSECICIVKEAQGCFAPCLSYSSQSCPYVRMTTSLLKTGGPAPEILTQKIQGGTPEVVSLTTS